MAAPRGYRLPRPNREFKTLIDKYPDETRAILDRPELIIFMNAWANFHADDPKDAFKTFYDLKLKPIL